jgi:thymidylate synthase
MAHTDKTYKTLCTKINTEGRLYEDKSRNVSRIQIESHTETQLQQWFSGFISKTTPLQVCKGELIWFLRGDTHIKYLLDNGILYGTKMPTTLCQSNFSKS